MYPQLAFLFFILLSKTTMGAESDPVDDFCILDENRVCKNPRLVTPEDFIFPGIKFPGNFSATGFSSVAVNPSSFPGLNTLGMSFVRADFRPGGINPPHSHPRATETVYVVRGKVYSGFVDSTNRVFAGVIEQGEVMVFPRGLVHFQMNVGKSDATVFGCFNSQNPGMQKIPNVLFGSGINDELLEKAFGLSLRQISVMRRRFLPKKGF
ncbi:germin-like protein subfamily 3 member 2 [Andrographis paniculata]|uniref:germin-like protein subfamily 3 member 2 n=1 Tax=Andrographis paniculata TaxID=175694 RepID=UPI0021E771D8|nr:germin-like protein subfamily 3 member 2 [Andrographis paniculata]